MTGPGRKLRMSPPGRAKGWRTFSGAIHAGRHVARLTVRSADEVRKGSDPMSDKSLRLGATENLGKSIEEKRAIKKAGKVAGAPQGTVSPER